MFCSLRVKIGATRRSQLRGFEEIDAAQIIKHEHFEPEPSYNNDIGLIILEKPYRNTGMIIQLKSKIKLNLLYKL